jgi:hypothetical protein
VTSDPTKVSASLRACATEPRTRSSSRPAHVIESSPLTPAMNMANAPEWLPDAYASEPLAQKEFPLGSEQRRLKQDNGRSRVWSSAIWAATVAPLSACNVRSRHTETVGALRVDGVIRNAHGWSVRTADPTPLVVAKEPVTVHQPVPTRAARNRRPGRG